MSDKRIAAATEENLYRIFTIPEEPDSTLARIEQEVSQNLDGFLRDHIVAVEKPLSEIEKDFLDSAMPEDCLLYTSPSPRDGLLSRMPSSA